MRVGICDYPSQYAFPPHGYGGIERWLWAVAVGAERAGADVHLIGPSWRDGLPIDHTRSPIRLEQARPGSRELDALRRLRLDLLVVGHEYPSLPAWRRTWNALDCAVVTFQHDPDFQHLPGAFDGTRSRLFCYSAEMAERYTAHRPTRTLSVQFGLDEDDPPPPTRGNDLLWLGRIDQDKAPHLAALAAQQLGRRLHVVGPVLDHDYVAAHRVLTAPHVTLTGEVAGTAKLRELRAADALVYTCARDYTEAGAAVFGEAIRSGTPVAALAWRSGTCAHAALCRDTGAIADLDAAVDDETAAARLAEAITATERLHRDRVQAIGLARFDPANHFRALAGLPADA